MRVVLTGWVALHLVARCALIAQASGQPVLRGRVIDVRTLTPLGDVSVVVTSGSDTVARVRSDSSGGFQAPTKAGSLTAHFARVGYRPDSIVASVGEFPLRVAMTPNSTIANTLAAVVVRDSTARTGFERRARRNSGGTFVRSEDIAKRKPLRTSELFRSLPGVRIDDSSGTTQLVSLRSTRQTALTPDRVAVGGDTTHMPSTNARRCVLRVGTEGHLMPPDFSVDEIRPEEILGIEVYLGAATIPAEFSSVQHDAPCGIIMIWTKSGSRP